VDWNREEKKKERSWAGKIPLVAPTHEEGSRLPSLYKKTDEGEKNGRAKKKLIVRAHLICRRGWSGLQVKPAAASVIRREKSKKDSLPLKKRGLSLSGQITTDRSGKNN